MSHQNQLKAARNPGRIDIKGRVAISVRRLTVYGTLQKNAFFGYLIHHGNPNLQTGVKITRQRQI